MWFFVVAHLPYLNLVKSLTFPQPNVAKCLTFDTFIFLYVFPLLLINPLLFDK
jgi:hypothetical protein